MSRQSVRSAPWFAWYLWLICAGVSYAGGREPHLRNGVRFLKTRNANAERQAAEWRETRPADAALMDALARVPLVVWLGDFSGDVEVQTRQHLERSRQQKALPVFVVYSIPDRDAGQYAKGGEASAEAYAKFIAQIAEAIGSRPAAVLLEPDALGQVHLFPEEKQKGRYRLLGDAVDALTASGSIDLYLDAGNCAWMKPEKMAARLKQANVKKARGFALNISSYQWTDATLAYGRRLSGLVGGKHFVIDTSRNGNGPFAPGKSKHQLAWCNPPGRAVGRLPTAETGDPLCDAFLWVKPPGESDGEYRGAPPAGHWYPENALELMRNAKQ